MGIKQLLTEEALAIQAEQAALAAREAARQADDDALLAARDADLIAARRRVVVPRLGDTLLDALLATGAWDWRVDLYCGTRRAWLEIDPAKLTLTPWVEAGEQNLLQVWIAEGSEAETPCSVDITRAGREQSQTAWRGPLRDLGPGVARALLEYERLATWTRAEARLRAELLANAEALSLDYTGYTVALDVRMGGALTALISADGGVHVTGVGLHGKTNKAAKAARHLTLTGAQFATLAKARADYLFYCAERASALAQTEGARVRGDDTEDIPL